MIFVIGGRFSGKGEYVRNKLNAREITGYDAGYEELKTAEAVRDFHLLVKKILSENGDAASEVKRLIEDNPNVIIISDEIGYGVVPVDKFEREYRETVGRICCYLAEKAETVIRVVCGIGNVIK